MSIILKESRFSAKDVKDLYEGLDSQILEASYGENEQIYGELNFYAARHLLSKLNIKEEDSILDIGSGFGRFIIQSFLESKAQAVYGVELNQKRYDIAAKAISRLHSYNHDTNNRILKNIFADITKIEAPNVTHIYTCSTVFPPILLHKIGDLVNFSKTIKKVASLRKIPNLANHKLANIIYLSCSWETVPCYIYSR